MSSFELRLTLLIIAAIIIVVMVVWYRGYTKEEYHDEDDDFDLLKEEDDLSLEIPSSEESELELSSDLREEFQDVSHQIKQDAAQERMLQARSQHRTQSVDTSAKELMVVLHVKASKDQPFTGPMILQMMNELDLEHGDMGVFHYQIERLHRKHSVFSVLNMVKPGTFDPEQMETFTTPGLTLLMQLPGPEEGLKAFNIMLNAAQRLATFMNGSLLDENRTVLTNQNISHLKEQVQLFSLRNMPRVSGA